MLKKFIVAILLIVYGISSSGMTLYVHYCCGRLDSINFSWTNNKKCPFASNSLRQGCCSSKQVELKIKSDHQPEYSVQSISKPLTTHQILILSTEIASYTLPFPIVAYSSTSPPFQKNISLYKLNCVYRI